MTSARTICPRAAGVRPDGAPQARWFDVDLSVSYFSPATDAWGIGRTRRICRDAVVFAPSGAAVRLGDELRYLLFFPGASRKPGAVGSCRGRVVRTEPAVVVTIDRCRLQTATAARASLDERTCRLVALCQDSRPGNPAVGRERA